MDDMVGRSDDELTLKGQRLFSLFPHDSWHERTQPLLEELKRSGVRIAIACSGGADSVFATLLCWAYFNGDIHLIHVNHNRRGAESDEEASFVEKISKELGCEISILNCPKNLKVGEGDLRLARIGLIRQQLERLTLKHLVQGHQKNDLAEAFLWRLSRGASPHGLCSPMPIATHSQLKFVRPFLSFSKEEIKDSLGKLQIPWREDSSNDSNLHLATV